LRQRGKRRVEERAICHGGRWIRGFVDHDLARQSAKGSSV
jgi:hypothetical protein